MFKIKPKRDRIMPKTIFLVMSEISFMNINHR